MQAAECAVGPPRAVDEGPQRTARSQLRPIFWQDI